MMPNQDTTVFFVRVVRKTEKDCVIHSISLDKEVWYLLPEELRALELHPLLSSKKYIQNAVTAIKNLNGYRTINVKINEDIKSTYFDEVGNVCFEQIPLEESVAMQGSQTGGFIQIELEDRIKRLEHQLRLHSEQNEIKLHNIEKKFILESFDRKQFDPKEWLRRFEDECSRFQINDNSLKIQALRFFVIGSAKDWYETTLTKIGLNASWSTWKSSFYNIFVDKGWSSVRKAFSFKYLGGSLIDYALSKEKLCLEAERKCTELSLVNQIVYGLPGEAQDELDRELVTTLDLLYEELRKLEDSFSRKKREKPLSPKLVKKPIGSQPNKKHESVQKNESQRKACSICVSQGFPNRFHSVADCRYKNWRAEKPKLSLPNHSTNLNDMEILNVDFEKQNLN